MNTALSVVLCVFFFFFKQKTAYEIKECDWSSDVCSSDLARLEVAVDEHHRLSDPVLRDKIVRRLRRCGFANAEVSAQPLRSGSLNDEILRERAEDGQARDPEGQIGRASCRERV